MRGGAIFHKFAQLREISVRGDAIFRKVALPREISVRGVVIFHKVAPRREISVRGGAIVDFLIVFPNGMWVLAIVASAERTHML
ncbi:hypothetical protein [Cohnella lupini]|uniref:Uncharacterized protein n=1 Tax=Cohnella lupini TaxID=1294267 RepID=A0A3D9HTU9_9BACL|nr:hypothetical protein [Cohnella lupini]RED52869.1 hypothetical protein DFP95_1291 [Cohnella lupini]